MSFNGSVVLSTFSYIKYAMIRSLIITWCITLVLALNAEADAIKYELELNNTAAQPKLFVKANIQSEMSGNVVANLPDWWAGTNHYKQIKNVDVPNHEFAVKNKKIIIKVGQKINNLTFSYEIHKSPNKIINIHECLIQNDLIHSPGFALFAIPDHFNNDPNLVFTINWRNIPKEFNFLSSYGDQSTIRFAGDINRLQRAFYSSGKFNVIKIPVANNKIVNLAISGSFSKTDEGISNFTQTLINSQRRFFKDYDIPFYAISLIEGNEENSMGGTCFNNSFIAYSHKNLDWLKYKLLFAHEHLHNWIGVKMSGSSTPEHYWFTEGFTDCLSISLLYKAGLISKTQLIQTINEILREYYLSPYLNKNNSFIIKNFWKNYECEKLPYRRGLAFYIFLNSLIKKNNNNNSIEDIILSVTKDQKFEIDRFVNALKPHLQEDPCAILTKYILKGETIKFDHLGAFKRKYMGRFDLGFSRDALVQNQEIRNINYKSNAYKCGLREGMKVSHYSFPNGRDSQTIAIIGVDNKLFQFKPEGTKKFECFQLKKSELGVNYLF